MHTWFDDVILCMSCVVSFKLHKLKINSAMF